MKFIGVGDVHFSEHFTHRIDNVWTAFESKWLQVFEWAKFHEVTAILCTGDVFHFKSPIRTSHRLMQNIMELLSKSPVSIYSAVGNHDIHYNDYSTLSQQPLGVLALGGQVKVQKRAAFGNVEVWFVPYGKDLPSYELGKQEFQVRIVVTHAFMDHSAGNYFGERVFSFSELEHWNANFVINGHDHQVYAPERVGNMLVSRPGALIRYARNDVDLNRKIQISLIDTDSQSICYLPIEHKSASEVFDITVKEIEAASKEEVQNFVGSLTGFQFVENKPLSQEIAELNIDSDVREELENYVAAAKE